MQLEIDNLVAERDEAMDAATYWEEKFNKAVIEVVRLEEKINASN